MGGAGQAAIGVARRERPPASPVRIVQRDPYFRAGRLSALDPGLATMAGQESATWPSRADDLPGMDWESFYNSFRQPDFISGYEIQNRLGGGAFGDVYKAHKHSIGKAYAIKFLKIEDDSQREAVQNELSQVRHFAAIDHPNLVSIEDMGTVMEVPYLIMGYAGEDTLARRLKHGPLRVDAALLYFVQACRGVLALHDRQLVHFDLKPSNIFLKGDVARVGDYGLSKLLTDGRMTLSYGRGTPQYMAPEMLRNRADQRADLYSLGVILYESLCGHLPFVGETPNGLVIRERDEPPSFPETFPAALRGPVEHCLRLDPDDRFESVEELLFEIEQTARPGDSVRLSFERPLLDEGAGSGAPAPDFEGRAGQTRAAERRSLAEELAAARDSEGLARPAAAGAPRLEQDSDALLTESASTPSSGIELRKTASELAVGAIRVARGVWAGLLLGAGSEAEEAESLEAFGSAPPGEPESGIHGHGAVAALRRARARLQPAAATSGEARDASRAASSEAALPIALAPVGPPAPPVTRALVARDPSWLGTKAVPVPPRVEGGIIGTFFATVVLGLEILASLVGSLLRGTAYGLRLGGDRLWRTSGLMPRAARLGFFLFAMALLGGLVMTAGMLFLGALRAS